MSGRGVKSTEVMEAKLGLSTQIPFGGCDCVMGHSRIQSPSPFFIHHNNRYFQPLSNSVQVGYNNYRVGSFISPPAKIYSNVIAWLSPVCAYLAQCKCVGHKLILSADCIDINFIGNLCNYHVILSCYYLVITSDGISTDDRNNTGVCRSLSSSLWICSFKRMQTKNIS